MKEQEDLAYSDDIMLHELAHGFQLVGAHYADPDFKAQLINAHDIAKSDGKWQYTYAISKYTEYWAVMVQIYFNATINYYYPKFNQYLERDKLQAYDPGAYSLLQEMFPCNNTYLKRCDVTRNEELCQDLKVGPDCELETNTLNCCKESPDSVCPGLALDGW